MEKKELSQKVAIVTGGGKGLGKAIALELAGRGATVVVADVDNSAGSEVRKTIEVSAGKSLFVPCDLRKENSVKDMVKKAVSVFSKIDILVNNAGIGRVALLWETPTEVWDDIMNVNLRGSYLCIKHTVPRMMEYKSGCIINISSGLGRQAQALMGAYAISKAGQIAMTVALAKETAAFGIRVNAVCPGPVETPWWDENRKSLSDILGVREDEVINWFTQNRQAIKKSLKPDDIAGAVCWLASEEASMMTGQAISIDGGHEFPTY